MNRISSVALFLLVLVTPPLNAQEPASTVSTGRIVGRIIDAQTGQGIAHVAIQVGGTRLGTISGVDGRYAIPRVPAGTVTMQARLIGYGPKTVTGIMLAADRPLHRDITVEPAPPVPP